MIQVPDQEPVMFSSWYNLRQNFRFCFSKS